MNLSGKLSQLAGLGDIVDGIVGGLTNAIQYIINGYLSLLANWFYSIFLALATILDLIQMLFRKMAGLEYYIVNGQETGQPRDLALELINNQIIMNVFWSLVVLGIVLLFITTFVAVIKSEYQPLETRAANNKARVIGKSLKSVMLMATVPVAAIFGLIVGNALLKSLDMATSNSQDAKLSGRIFVAAAYESNRAREGTGSFDQEFLDSLANQNHFGIFQESSSGFIVETVADKIDGAFAERTAVDAGYDTDFSINKGDNPTLHFVYNYMGEPDYPEVFSIYNYRLVWFYYNLNTFNFFIGIGVVIMLIAILLQVLLGLVKRLYGLTMLFIVVPPIIALTPINEEPYKKWKGEFVKNALSAYSTIVVMNIYIMLIPVLGDIQFFVPTDTISGLAISSTALQILNMLAQLLILIGGAVFFKDFSSALAGIIGADDALKDGAGKSQDFLKAASKATAIGGAVAGSGMKLTSNVLGGGAKTGVKAVKGMAASYKNAKDNGWATEAALAKSLFSAPKHALKAGLGEAGKRISKPFRDENGKFGIKNAVEKFAESDFYKKSGVEALFTPNRKSMREKDALREERKLRQLQIADLQSKQNPQKATTQEGTQESSAGDQGSSQSQAAEAPPISNDAKASYLGSASSNLENINAKISKEENELKEDAQLKKGLRKYKDDVLQNKQKNIEALKKERAKYEKEFNAQKGKVDTLEAELKKNNLSLDDVHKNEKMAVDKLSKSVIETAKEIKKIEDALKSSK